MTPTTSPPRRHNKWYLVLGLIAGQILISACSHQILSTNTQVPSLWPRHHEQMRGISNWHIKGKIGYENASEGGSTWLDWHQQVDQFSLLLSGPFGAGTVQIFGDDDFVTLRQAKAPDISAVSAKTLVRHLLGWELPIDELSYWIRGIPAPNALTSEQHFNQQSLLANLHQSGWQLVFSKYRHTKAGILPGKITATQGETHFKLIIKEHLFTTPSNPSLDGPAQNLGLTTQRSNLKAKAL
ncbi:MAG: lipoprotein insertase outer membrane protein LolB [Porticoccaceae bacterium]|nr:lipoprotein insertase outer membrane protein LolB [Porticoccaceae bacterium]